MNEMVTGADGVEKLSAAITGERDEVKAMCVRIASEAARHDAGILNLLHLIGKRFFQRDGIPTLSPKERG
jgi:hypothetical protein